MFEIGDRVEAKALEDSTPNGELKNGDTGTIVGVSKCSDGLSLDVFWDRNVGGHDLLGRCTMGHGWVVVDGEIEKLEGEE